MDCQIFEMLACYDPSHNTQSVSEILQEDERLFSSIAGNWFETPTSHDPLLIIELTVARELDSIIEMMSLPKS